MNSKECHSRELGPDGRWPVVGYTKFKLAYDSYRQQAPTCLRESLKISVRPLPQQL
jgi:hypothetical protein